jgi:hypothetical protein
MSVELPTNPSKSPMLERTGWPTVWIHFTVPGTWLKRFDVLEGDLAMSATIISSDCGATARSRGFLRLGPHFLRNRPNGPTRKSEPLTALKRELSPLYPFLQHAFTHVLEIGMFLDV